MKTFVPVDDDALIRLVQAAARRIVFIAPGLTLPVAQALGRRIEEMDRLDVTVVLDPDEEVCRIGYGELAALEHLQRLANQQGYSLRSQPGLRVGVLLSDENMMVWSPTPRSVEAPPESKPADLGLGANRLDPGLAPNGLMLGADPAAQLAQAVAAEGTATRPQEGEIGRRAITPAEVKVTADALAKNPPIPVDLARVTRVFSTKLQFVEFKVTRAKLSKMKLTVPSKLLNADAKDDLENMIESNLRAFGDLRDVEVEVPAFINGEPATVNGKAAMEKVSESSLERERHNIERQFVFDIAAFGRLIEKDRKQEFLRLVESYKVRVLAHSTGVRQLLESQAAQIVGDAVDLVLARHASGRAHGKTGPAPKREELKKSLLAGLERAKGEVPTVSLVFKDVTYEQTQSPDFHDRVRKAVPGAVLKRLGKWHDQYQATKERAA